MQAKTYRLSPRRKLLLLVFVISGLIIVGTAFFGLISPDLSPRMAARLAGTIEGVLTLLTWLAGTGMLVYAAVNAISAYSFLKQRQWLPALLWLALGLVQLLVVAAMISTVLD